MRATVRLLGGCRIGGRGDHTWSQLRTRTFVFERHTVSIKTYICQVVSDANYRNDNETCTECLLCARSCANTLYSYLFFYRISIL